MTTSPNSVIPSEFVEMARIEQAAIDFVDSCISPDDSRARISDVYNRLLNEQPQQLIEYIGTSPQKVSSFVQDRRHLWKSNTKEGDLQSLPKSLRLFIWDLIASIGRTDKKRAHLSQIFQFIATYHAQILPHLPPPVNGNSLESAQRFILDQPKLFRLINEADGNAWTRTTPLAQVGVECTAIAVDNVVLSGVTPDMIRGRDANNEKSPDTIRGVAEILRMSTVWGYLRSEMYGTIFFTMRACGVEDLMAAGFKITQMVYFEAKFSSSETPLNGTPVRWRATTVRYLRPDERDSTVSPLKSVRAEMTTAAAAAAAAASARSTPTSDSLTTTMSGGFYSGQPAFSSTSSNASTSSQPKGSIAGNKLPAGLADWMKRRQEGASAGGSIGTPSPRHSPSPATGQRPPAAASASAAPASTRLTHDGLTTMTYAKPTTIRSTAQEIEDELDNGDGASGQGVTTLSYGAFRAFGRSDYAPERAVEAHSHQLQRVQPMATNQNPIDVHRGHAEAYFEDEGDVAVESIDRGIQTDPTDEELLLRLLRTAPELLDLVRVVMRPE